MPQTLPKNSSGWQHFGNTFERMFDYNRGMRRVYDWLIVQAFHDEGHGFVECQKRFGFSHTAWVKAVKRGDLIAQPRPWAERGPCSFADRRRIYDWASVQTYYDEGHSFRECQVKFGFCNASWHKACKRGEIRTRPLGMSILELTKRGISRYNVKMRLLRAGLLKNECSDCGLTEWCGKRLSMHIDHINGIHNDHRLENLRMLCPNCHSQTDTYGGKNRRRGRRLQDHREAA